MRPSSRFGRAESGRARWRSPSQVTNMQKSIDFASFQMRVDRLLGGDGRVSARPSGCSCSGRGAGTRPRARRVPLGAEGGTAADDRGEDRRALGLGEGEQEAGAAGLQEVGEAVHDRPGRGGVGERGGVARAGRRCRGARRCSRAGGRRRRGRPPGARGRRSRGGRRRTSAGRAPGGRWRRRCSRGRRR